MHHVVIGGEAREGVPSRIVTPAFSQRARSYDIIHYALRVPIADDSFAAWAEVLTG